MITFFQRAGKIPRTGRDLAMSAVRLGRGLLTTAFALSAMCMAALSSASAAEVSFGSPPATAKQAWETLDQRQRIVTNYMACGNEIFFFSKVGKMDDDPGGPLPE